MLKKGVEQLAKVAVQTARNRLPAQAAHVPHPPAVPPVPPAVPSALQTATHAPQPGLSAFRPTLSAQRQQQIDHAVDQHNSELGSVDGISGSASSHLRETVIRNLHEQGVQDRLSHPGSDPHFFVAGSGVTQENALARAAQAQNGGRGEWHALQGGRWVDNLHQLAGTGTGPTAQQAEVAYALGRATPASRIIAHSQGNLTVENVTQTVERSNPGVRDLSVTGIGSPLPYAHGPNSERITGRADPIQAVRTPTGLALGNQPSPGPQTFVASGHGAEETLGQIVKQNPNHFQPKDKSR